VFYKPGQREGSTNTRIMLFGDVKRAEGYYPQAAQMLQQANFDTAATGEFFRRERNLGGGVRYKCYRDLYQDFIDIDVRPKPVPPGPMHLNFDASKQTEFGRYFYDSRAGLPLYYSKFNGVNFNKSGIALEPVNADSEIDGTIYCNPKTSSGAYRTIVTVSSVDFPFYSGTYYNGESYVPYTNGGPGSSHLYTYTMAPCSRSAQWVVFYSAGSPAYLATYIYASGDIEYRKEEIGASSTNAILITRSKSEDIIYHNGGKEGATFNSVNEVFYNGSKVLEWANEAGSWANYYGDNRFYLNCQAKVGYTPSEPSMNGSMIVRQQQLYDLYISDDGVQRLTDELAKKWGF
jgi:hypothetical protein